jgi:hypothetical protein
MRIVFSCVARRGSAWGGEELVERSAQSRISASPGWGQTAPKSYRAGKLHNRLLLVQLPQRQLPSRLETESAAPDESEAALVVRTKWGERPTFP